MNKEHYIQTKAEFKASGNINNNMLQYMYEFYKVRVKERDQPMLCPSLEFFTTAMFQWFSMPVSMGNTIQELMMNQRQQTINKGIKEMFEYFDKIHN
jgi:hypothetical protein